MISFALVLACHRSAWPEMLRKHAFAGDGHSLTTLHSSRVLKRKLREAFFVQSCLYLILL